MCRTAVAASHEAARSVRFAEHIIGINGLAATHIPPVIPWHTDAMRREAT
jgi:hypothetical protein